MKLRILWILLLPLPVILSLWAGHRLGHSSGQAAVARQLAILEKSRAASAIPAASSPLAQSIRRSGPELERYLAELKSKFLETGHPAEGFDASDLKRELAGLSLAEVRAAMDLLADWPQGLPRMRLSMALLSRWSGEDPAAAAAYVRENRGEAGAFATLWFAAVYPNWADRDPKAAARELTAALQDEEDEILTGSIGNVVFTVMEKLAHADLPFAFQQVAALPEWAKPSAFGAVSKQVHGNGRASFLAAIRGLPVGDEATAWQRAAAVAMAPVDAEAASQWIDSLGLPEESAMESNRTVFSQWKDSDPRAATAWAMSRLPGSEHPRLLEKTVETWGAREPNECGKWLDGFGTHPLMDPALARFAILIAEKDPESARVWAGRISDPAPRNQVLETLAGK